nr:tetratricopeptide repeat protein [Paenibacillus sp. NEAU-GSW1]
MVAKIDVFKAYGNTIKRTDPNKAFDYIQKAIDLFHKLDEYGDEKIDVGADICDLLLNLGQVYRQLNQYDDAMECYDKAISIHEDQSRSGKTRNLEELMSLYNSRGNLERDRGRDEESIDFYSLALLQHKIAIKEGKHINNNLYRNVLLSRYDAYLKLGEKDKANMDLDLANQIPYDPELAAQMLKGKL